MTEEEPTTPPVTPPPAAPPEPPEEEEEDEEKSKSLIDKANLAAVRQEEANTKHEALLNRQERMKVEQTFGGKTDAGAPPPKEETPEEYAARVMKGEI